MAEAVRIPIKVELIDNRSGKTISYVKTRMQSKVSEIFKSYETEYANVDHSYIATVLYNEREGVWTKFEFNDMSEFRAQMKVATEVELLKDLIKDGTLSKEYFGKGANSGKAKSKARSRKR